MALLIAVTATGCATWPDRPLVTAAEQAAARLPDFPIPVRYWSDAPIEHWSNWHARWMEDRPSSFARSEYRMLAISSGSDKGAFAAGYLSGWSVRGDRPQFDIVTGVSTGALIAPFAFLGPDHDATLREIYTGVAARDIFRPRPISGLLGGPSLADSKPLQRLIEKHVTPSLIAQIAAEHRKGRRLLVMTTNLDAQRGVVWDVGEIAASDTPGQIDLIRKVLLASASIPGVFPPVLIEVTTTGRRFSEMHVDGGTIGSMFVLPTRFIWANAEASAMEASKAETLLLYNGRLDPEYAVVEPRTFSIIERALATVIGEADRQNLRAFQQFAERSGHGLKIESIGEDFDKKADGLFDPDYMVALFSYGAARARSQ